MSRNKGSTFYIKTDPPTMSKSVAPAVFLRVLIEKSCSPAHDGGSMCEVTQANYHVRGSGSHRVWDVYLRPHDSPG